ncbi:MAG: zinc metallopeptidase, partial [Synergistes sp.]|nr:zinc metallopeptidase [Synergistes sp.]
MFPFFFDPTMIILIPAVLFSLWAQYKVKSAYSEYGDIRASRGVTARDVSAMLLAQNGLTDVNIEHIHGELTDHYDPSARVLRLSDNVDGSRSIAAIGVAAHEVGHAIQHKTGYSFLRLRNAISPAAGICSSAAMPIFFIGFLIGHPLFMNVGIWLFCGVFIFYVITLPLEFDASGRALKMLSDTGTLTEDELCGAKKVLDAAALTYVAALVMTVLQLVRL